MAAIDRVLERVKGIGSHIGVSGGGGVTGLQRGLMSEGFLKELAAALGKLAPLLTKTFGNAAGKVSPEIAGALKQVMETVGDKLTSALQNLDNLPGPFSKGAMHAFENLKALGEISKCLAVPIDVGNVTFEVNGLDLINAKIEIVGDSLLHLLDAVVGAEGRSQTFLFRGVFEAFQEIFKGALEANADLGKLLGGSLITKILSTELLESILQAALEQKGMFFADFPAGKIAGVLHRWINDPATFGDVEGICNANGAWKLTLAREYRMRLVAAYDAYFAQRLADVIEDALSNADQRVSFELLADVVAIFFDVTIEFVLESNCAPHIHLELPSFDDIGFKLARIAAPLLHVPIKGLMGVLFNGVSFWSLNNPPFIELIASIVARFFSAIIGAVVGNLTATVRVIGVYSLPDVEVEGELFRWSTMEAIEGNVCLATDRLMYVALFRRPDLIAQGGNCSLSTFKNNDMVKGIAMDIGAYLDLAFLQHIRAPRFDVDLGIDRVTIARAEYVDGRLLIVATTDHTLDEFQPILRAYFCCRMVPMRPGSDKSDPYTVDIPCRFLGTGASVTVVSNLGGTSNRTIQRI